MLRSKKDVYLLSVAITAGVLLFAILMVLLVFPRDLWEYQFRFVGLSVLLLCAPVAFLLAEQIRRTNALSTELQRLLRRDRLSGVSTRDHFFDAITQQTGAPGIVLMIDIDHFKAVNDTYGHLAGDDVIRAVAATLHRYCRPDDLLCRYGGEEFVVFLPHALPERGEQLAENMRVAVAGRAIETQDEKLSVTISIGGTAKEDAQDIISAIKLADDALYRAKKQGRNRVNLTWQDTGAAEAGFVRLSQSA